MGSVKAIMQWLSTQPCGHKDDADDLNTRWTISGLNHFNREMLVSVAHAYKHFAPSLMFMVTFMHWTIFFLPANITIVNLLFE